MNERSFIVKSRAFGLRLASVLSCLGNVDGLTPLHAGGLLNA